MKKLFFLGFLTLGVLTQVHGQVQLPAEPKRDDLVKKGETVKTMDRQQVITNYLQGVAGDITSDSKKVQLKASIFALNWKDSVAKFQSDYYLAKYWQRNMQILLGSTLDKSSNLNGFSAGITYNLCNDRDPSQYAVYDQLDQATRVALLPILAQAVKGYIQSQQLAMIRAVAAVAHQQFVDGTTDYLTDNILKAVSSPYITPDVTTLTTFKNDIAALSAEIKSNLAAGKFNIAIGDPSPIFQLTDFLTTYYMADGLNGQLTNYLYYVDKNGKEPDSMSVDLKVLVQQINAVIAALPGNLHGTDLLTIYTYLHNDFQKAVNKIAKKPQFTIGYNYTYMTKGVTYQHVPNFQFLVGLGKNESPRSWELSIVGTDTLATDTIKKSKPVNRNIATLQVGFNKVMFTGKNDVSLLETKFALEGDNIWSGRNAAGGEKQWKGFASMTIQGRPSAKSPWFKLIVKYNKKTNFLGFLNVTLNLDSSATKGN